MKQTITFGDFCDAFRDMDRNENFSYAGKRALFDYLEQYEEDCGQEVELDVIALCCDYSEDSVEDIASNYGIEADEDEDLADAVRDYLEEHTTIVGETDRGFVYCSAF